MSNFKMRNQPKRPAAPQHIDMEVGNYFTLSYMSESIEKFKSENPGVDPKDIMIEAEDNGYDGTTIILTSPPQSKEIYDKKIQEYKIERKAYDAWRVKYKKEIGKYKAAKKKLVAKRKLERSKERLTKELAAVEGKLEKA